MRTVLDTSVVSQRVKANPVESVMTWWQRQSTEDLHLSAVTVHELRYGFELLDQGKRRRAFEHWLESTVLPMFDGRVLSVDLAVADRSGRLLAAAKGSGADVGDAIIAATALVHGMRLATLNRKHFERFGVELVEW